MELSAEKASRILVNNILKYDIRTLLTLYVTGLKMIVDLGVLEDCNELKPIKKMLNEYDKLITK